jgi:hypothetical protein
MVENVRVFHTGRWYTRSQKCDSKPVNCRKGLERTESWGRQIADVK